MENSYLSRNQKVNISVIIAIEVMHYNESIDVQMMFGQPAGSTDMVNCGVYLFTVSEMYRYPLFIEYGEKYRRILAISKDDNQEKSLSQL